jgi:hypothetical protein
MDLIIGPGNYDVTFTDVDGRPKKVTLFMGEEHVEILDSSAFRVIVGWEKKLGKSITKIISLGQNQAATLELTN